ncbi:Gfo/Idh/MocA family oxidoreductase [Streptomyces massasporeus]|uniref:Gfo/Idh/MocA family protein n=1 Tax=Streptomyces massasporeus TaxID=67324 RepID=UPI0033B7F6C4
MTHPKIRVGIIGAGPERSWAARSHVPALQALGDRFELVAVGTSRPESAGQAAEQWSVPHAFADARRLAEHPDVDLVTVAVKVPHHLELVETALGAGKHVYCEWPLARTTAEAEQLLKAAQAAGVRHWVGLQARQSPVVSHAAELIADGYVGKVTSVHVHASRFRGTGVLPSFAAYTLDRANGAGTLEVAGGHTLDVVEALVGPLTQVSSALSLQREEYTLAETGEPVRATSPDVVQIAATTTGGAAVSVHLHDGRIHDAGTLIGIAGTEGSLTIASHGPGAPSGVQISELRLLGARGADTGDAELETPAHHRVVPTGVPGVAALGVAQNYARLAADLANGTQTVPGFREGVRLHRLLDAVRHSAATGTRQSVPATGD